MYLSNYYLWRNCACNNNGNGNDNIKRYVIQTDGGYYSYIELSNHISNCNDTGNYSDIVSVSFNIIYASI